MAVLEGPVFYRALIRREALTPAPLAVLVDDLLGNPPTHRQNATR